MTHRPYPLLTAVCAIALLLPLSTSFAEDNTTVRFDRPLGVQGTVNIHIATDKAYRTGPEAKRAGFTLFEIPDLATCRFTQASTVCELRWVWARGIEADDLGVQLPVLPGPEEYFIQFTWDAEAGRFNGYVNGAPLRLPDTQIPPWAAPQGTEIRLASGPFKTTLVSALPNHLGQSQARALVPENLLGRHAELFGAPEEVRSPIDVASRLGNVLYESSFAAPDSVEGWVLEGPGLLSFEGGWMTMASAKPDSPKKDGHIVHWCPNDFPESFVAEWEMQITSESGLCIVFFAARGVNGEDIFDPALPKRTGIFRQYHSGAISCYHISYYASTPSSPGRITSNLRKNRGFHLVSNGPPGINPGSHAMHAVRLVKDGPHLQLLVDDEVIIDFTDDGKRYGPVLEGGKIGLRQMQWTKAQYRNFRVRELRSK
ncbi:MAG: DUF1961 family protein [bacterium]|nr:DUF1961 family protein [bacterium]